MTHISTVRQYKKSSNDMTVFRMIPPEEACDHPCFDVAKVPNCPSSEIPFLNQQRSFAKTGSGQTQREIEQTGRFAQGERWLKDVYEALRAGPVRKNGLLVHFSYETDRLPRQARGNHKGN